MCDSAGQCAASCDNTGNCNNCQQCAVAGNCADDLELCQNNAECVALNTCLGTCSTQACVDNCVTAHSSGVADFNSLVLCATCQECPADCNGPAAGCP